MEHIHESHEIAIDFDAPGPGLRCGKCKAYACGSCGEPDKDILFAPCAGVPWWEAGESVSVKS